MQEGFNLDVNVETLTSTFKYTNKICEPRFFGYSLHNDYMSPTTMNTKRFWSPTHNKKLVQLSIVQAMSTKSSNQTNISVQWQSLNFES
jgi:hypothetical protein